MAAKDAKNAKKNVRSRARKRAAEATADAVEATTTTAAEPAGGETDQDETEREKIDQALAALLEEHAEELAALQEQPKEKLAVRLLIAEAGVAKLQDDYIRARAEVENIQRRSQNEISAARKFAIEGFARELLTVLDSLDQASLVEIDDATSDAVVQMREGLELTLKQFEKVMERFGVAVVEADAGTKFDPEFHQAISMIPDEDIASDHIVSVMQKGYALKDRLLRPAMVVVAK